VFNHVKAARALFAACSGRGDERDVVASRRDSVPSSNDRGSVYRDINIGSETESPYDSIRYVISLAICPKDSAYCAFVATKA
jgi:hypothetical protein